MIPLNQIQVPKPCGEDWGTMDGDARRRFCAGCGCHVHDLSAMTRDEAQGLLDQAAGRVCVRFQTLPDGTVLTQAAPLPVERHRQWPRRLAAAASWALAFAVTGFGLTARAVAPLHRKAANTAPPNVHATASVFRRGRVTVGHSVMPRPMPRHPLGQINVRPPATTMGTPLPTMMGKPILPPVSHHTMGMVVTPLPPKK